MLNWTRHDRVGQTREGTRSEKLNGGKWLTGPVAGCQRTFGSLQSTELDGDACTDAQQWCESTLVEC
jgi:hypothetical protein